MFKKLIYTIPLMLLLGLALTSTASAELVGWWKLDEGGGSIAYDSSASENHATLVGQPQWIVGRYGAGVEFDGVDDYVDLPIGSIINSLTNSTFTIWANFSNEGGSWQRLWDFGSGTTTNMFLTPRIGTEDEMRFAITIGGNAAGAEDQTTTEATLQTDWHHVAVVIDIDNTTHRIYVDGEPNAENTAARYSPSDLGFTLQNWLGKSQYSADGFYDGSLDDFRIYNHALSQEEIQATMISDQVYTAIVPYPGVGATDVARNVDLSWVQGSSAVTHDLYFGTDFNDVNEASRDDPRDILLVEDQTELTFNPPGDLDYNVTYYWRVDEINNDDPDSPWKGNVWNFTILNYIVVEDFEDYNDYSPKEVFNTWVDGWGVATNGSTSGYPAPDFVGGEHYLEDGIVHGDQFSLPLFYDNSAGLSWATMTLTSDKDWTVDDVITLTIFFYGDAGNEAVPMYAALNDDAVVTHPEPRAAMIGEWTRWDILLQDFADMGVDLINVNSITLGFGDPANPTVGGEGYVLFDDIRLYRSLPGEYVPKPDSVDPGTANLVAYYDFENDLQDSSGKGYHSTGFNDPPYIKGATGFGSAVSLNGFYHYIALPIDSLIASLDDTTIACWANFSNNETGSYQRLWDFGVAPPDDDTDPNIYMFVTPRGGTSGPLQFGITTGGNVTQSNIYAPATLPTGWHHVAASIDSSTMTMRLYQDAKLVAEGETSFLPSDLGQTDQNWIGRSQWTGDDYYQGGIDEFRIYNRVLTETELLYLMGW
jgi:hypothetical protein